MSIRRSSIRTSTIRTFTIHSFTAPKGATRRRRASGASSRTVRLHRAVPALLLPALALLIGIGQGGCSDTASNPKPSDTTAKIVRPGAGSILHRRWVNLTDAGAEIAGTEKLDTVTVISASASKFGRDSVVLFSKDVMLFSDALRYEANGDVSYISTYRLTGPGFNPYVPEAWIAMPFGSRAAGVVRDYDSSAVVSGEGAGCRLKETTTYIGPDTLSVPAPGTACIRVQVDRNLDVDTGPGTGTNRRTVATYWFAPSIGLVVRRHVKDSRYGSPTSYSRYDVLDYTLK